MLAKRGDQGECQQERDRCTEHGGEEVPLAGGRRIAQPPQAQPTNPDHDGTQPGHVEQRADTHHQRHNRPQRALTKGERAAGRAGRTELGGDQETNNRQDEHRPGGVQHDESRNARS